MRGGHPLVFAKFLGVGTVNALVGLGVIYACKKLREFGDILAYASGYAVGLRSRCQIWRNMGSV